MTNDKEQGSRGQVSMMNCWRGCTQKNHRGVDAQEFGWIVAASICGSLWGDGGCIFWHGGRRDELLALGVSLLRTCAEIRRPQDQGTGDGEQDVEGLAQDVPAGCGREFFI
jgi:hypothetical protein